jgi:pimeloyl-ACP methyl ester carboxylesterase
VTPEDPGRGGALAGRPARPASPGFCGYVDVGALELYSERHGAWTSLVVKVNELDRSGEPSWPRARLAALQAPALLINGDSDIVRPEHAVLMFRLLGGGVPGDPAGLRKAQLALLPGTSHEDLLDRVEWLCSMITEFLLPRRMDACQRRPPGHQPAVMRCGLTAS